MGYTDPFREEADKQHIEQAAKLVEQQIDAAQAILDGQPLLGDPVAEAVRSAAVLNAVNATFLAIRQRFDGV